MTRQEGRDSNNCSQCQESLNRYLLQTDPVTKGLIQNPSTSVGSFWLMPVDLRSFSFCSMGEYSIQDWILHEWWSVSKAWWSDSSGSGDACCKCFHAYLTLHYHLGPPLLLLDDMVHPAWLVCWAALPGLAVGISCNLLVIHPAMQQLRG